MLGLLEGLLELWPVLLKPTPSNKHTVQSLTRLLRVARGLTLELSATRCLGDQKYKWSQEKKIQQNG